MTKTHGKVIFLQGRKTYLRPIEVSDAPAMTRWINDPDIRRYLTATKPLSETDEQEWAAGRSKDHRSVVLAIVKKDDDVHIGNIGIHEINWRNNTGVFGIIIGEPAAHKNGYGTEAANLLFKYAFETLNLRKIRSLVMAPNMPSTKLHKKLGFLEEGVRKKEWFVDGAYLDDIQYALFREDWRKLQIDT